jgi:hypothetical protein
MKAFGSWRVKMKTAQLNQMLSFSAEHPFIYLRDHEGGHIRVLARNGEWLATIVPDYCPEGHLLLFKNSSEDEFRGSWGLLATILSVYQQTGGDWASVYEAEEQALEWE